MRRLTAGVRFLALATTVTVMLTGCIFPVGGDPADRPVDTRLYLGPVPAPAPLPPLPELPPRPEPPANGASQAARDEYQAALDRYVEAAQSKDYQEEANAFHEALSTLAGTAQAGGADSVAAWQTLFVTAGIAVAGDDGTPIEVNGETGAGWPMTDAELRVQALMATSSGGLRLIDLAYALQGIPALEGVDVATALYDDLRNNPAVFSTVLRVLNPRYLTEDEGHGFAPMDEVVLTWGQVGLILRRLSAELLSASGAVEAIPTARSGVRTQPAAFTTDRGPRAADKQPCDVETGNTWADELLKQAYKVEALGFDKLLDLMLPKSVKNSVTVGISTARLVLAFAAVLAKAFALEASFTMADSPLVRTKDTHPGDVSELTVRFEFDGGSWGEIAGCLNLLLAFTGFELPAAPSGPAKDINVDLSSESPGVLRIGDGAGSSSPVTRATTDKGGDARFTVSGAPQGDIIPEQAEPDPRKVRLVTVSNLESNDIYKDFASLPWAAADAAGSAGLSLIPTLLSRIRILTHSAEVPVRDWKLEADFAVTAVGAMTKHEAWYFSGGGGCAEKYVVSESVDGNVSFASDPVEVSAILLSNPQGNLGDQAVVFVPRGQKEFMPVDIGNGVRLFVLPGEYSTEKSHSKPGKGELPALKVNPPSQNCGYGDGSGGVAPPQPDCGVRTYAGALEVGVPSPKTIHLTGQPASGPLWKDCGPGFHPMDPPVAEGLANCDSPKRTGGKFPAIAEVYDTSTSSFEVSGSLTCRSESPGSLRTTEYNWTLVFCRIVEGEPAC
ncbi:MAG TPA: hypothetical protein VFS93_02130 [Terrimesophilobacter sp.]|nr:hypothetical protein [Terrimesophilobacter sp.]